MKKMFLSCLFALSLVPMVSNAAQVTITNESFTGGGFLGDTSVTAENTVSNSHSGIAAGFSDIWDVNLLPSSETFSIVNSVPKFASFLVEYSLDEGVSWITYDQSTVSDTVEVYTASIVDISAFKLRISGDATNQFGLSGSYQMTVNSVQAVPVPAAVWLFGSALMGLVGVTRRNKKAAVV